jgi:hypothetical protein
MLSFRTTELHSMVPLFRITGQFEAVFMEYSQFKEAILNRIKSYFNHMNLLKMSI